MGNGTDIAMQSSKIALVKGDLNGIVKARELSHKVMRNIKQNLFFAFAYNALGVPVAAGILFPFFGILLSSCHELQFSFSYIKCFKIKKRVIQSDTEKFIFYPS